MPVEPENRLKLTTLDIVPGEMNKKFINGSLGSIVVRVVGVVLTIFSSFILGRILGVESYGSFAYAISWALVLSVISLSGTDVLAIREVAKWKSRNDFERLNGIIIWSIIVVILLSLIATLLAAAGLCFFGGYLDELRRSVLLLALPLIFMVGLLRLGQGILQGHGFVTRSQFPQLVFVPLALLILAIWLNSIKGASVTNIMIAYIVSVLGALTLVIIWIWQRIKKPNRSYKRMYEIKAWRSSAITLGFVSMTSVFNDQIGVLVLGSTIGSNAAGLFDVARKAAGLVPFILVVVNTPLAPLVAELHHRGDKQGIQEVVRRATYLAFAGAAIVAFLFLSTGSWMLSQIGAGFQEAYGALVILSISQIVNAGSGSVALLLNMTGHEDDAVKGLIVSSLMNVFLCILLIPHWGVKGAAIATGVSLITWNILLVSKVRKKLDINPTILKMLGR